MKRLTTILSFCCAALLTAACSKQNDTESNPTQQGNLQPMTFTATGTATRTQLTDGNNVHWQAGDEIAIISMRNGEVSRDHQNFYTNDNGATATFEGVADANADKYSAFYPASALNWVHSDGAILILPSVQQATKGSFDPAANLSCAESTDGQTLHFENLCGLVKFRLPADETRIFESVTLHAFDKQTDNETLSGRIDYNMQSDKVNYQPSDDDTGAYEVTLQGRLEAGADYYIAVKPATLEKGFYMTFTLGNGHMFSYEITSRSVDIVAGQILNLGELGSDRTKDDLTIETNPDDPQMRICRVYSERGLRAWASMASKHEIESGVREPFDFNTIKCILENDIFLNGVWTPVGHTLRNSERPEEGYDVTPFRGTFDGNGHTIGMLKVKGPAQEDYGSYAGFFSMLQDATVRNVRFESPEISGGNVAVVAGQAIGKTTIENCHVFKGRVSGGYIGYESDITLYEPSHAGGIVARIMNSEDATITGCTVRDSEIRIAAKFLDPEAHRRATAGGIVGHTETIVVMEYCHFKGDITVDPDSNRNAAVGGIAGETYGDIYGCTADAEISCNNASPATYSYVGGIVGYHGGVLSKITGCVSSGSISKFDQSTICGGLLGYLTYCSLYGSYSTLTFDNQGSEDNTGGLFGLYDKTEPVESCFTTNNNVSPIGALGEYTAVDIDELNKQMMASDITLKNDEMNTAIKQQGVSYEFQDNTDGRIEFASGYVFDIDKDKFPLIPVMR